VPARHGDLQPGEHLEARVVLPSDCEILIVRDFAAPRDLVFEAWTTAEHVEQWWDPTRERLTACEIDLRPGGRFRFVPGGARPPFVGVYREILPPERLVFTAGAPSGKESVGTLLFEERRGRTTLRLTIACASRADRDALLALRVDAGTVQTLENLGEYLTDLASPADSPPAT
jgi:uncharacterized protein YndB with AHSA1/START domain